MRFGSLFSGIGGLDLGLERAGMTCAWQVEIDEWCQRVLARHWPNVPRWDDASTFPPDEGRPGRDASWNVDLVCGGFPCQPVSLAGKRRGQDDERWLWPEFARIVRLLRPRYVLVENVPGLLARGMGDVLGDLAASGYDTEWDCIPAAAVGAPHLRYRVFIVAHAASEGWGPESTGSRPETSGRPQAARGLEPRRLGGEVADSNRRRLAEQSQRNGRPLEAFNGAHWDDAFGRGLRDWWATEPDVGRVAHGVPSRVDRLRGLGNAVVPQVAEFIGRRLMEVS